MGIAVKYLSKTNNGANPEWVSTDEVKKAFMQGRTIIIVENNIASMVYGIYSDDIQTVNGSFVVGGTPK